jgi:hypothetical protein
MSHPPTPPTADPSEPEVRLYNSRPTLDVPAVGEAGRPPPVKFMCVCHAIVKEIVHGYPAEVLMLEQVNARIPESVTTPQARSFHHATSKGAIPFKTIRDWGLDARD